jgi:hypothetical protein
MARLRVNRNKMVGKEQLKILAELVGHGGTYL